MKNTLSDPLYGKELIALLLWSTNIYFPSDFYSRWSSKVNVNICWKSRSVMGNQENKPWKRGELFGERKALTVQYKKDRSATNSTTTSTTSLWTPALCSFMFIDSDLASYWSSIVWLYEPCLFWQFKIEVYIKWRSMQGVKCEGDVGVGFLFKQKVFVEQHIFLCHRWWLKGDKIKFPLMKACYFSGLFVQN